MDDLVNALDYTLLPVLLWAPHTIESPGSWSKMAGHEVVTQLHSEAEHQACFYSEDLKAHPDDPNDPEAHLNILLAERSW